MEARRKTAVRAGTGKLKGRFCVIVKLNPGERARTPRKGELKGMAPAPIQFRGCFTSKAEAEKKARHFATVARLPAGKGKRPRKSARRARR